MEDMRRFCWTMSAAATVYVDSLYRVTLAKDQQER